MSQDKNPKDLVGMRKVGMHYIPNAVLLQLSLAMKEGAGKYGAHNWREHKIQASEYYDATQRHLMEWWEGETWDRDSNLPNLIKALACLVILQDAADNDMLIDDRPMNKYPKNWLKQLNKKAADLVDQLPWDKPAYTRYTTYQDVEPEIDLTKALTTGFGSSYHQWDYPGKVHAVPTTVSPHPPLTGSPDQLPLDLGHSSPTESSFPQHWGDEARSYNAGGSRGGRCS